MPDTTGTFFNGNVYAYSLDDLPGLSTWSMGSSFSLGDGVDPDTLSIDASGENPFLTSATTTMSATGTVGDDTFSGSPFVTTNVWQVTAPDGNNYWVARILEPSTGAEGYISNHVLDSDEDYTIVRMDSVPQTGTTVTDDTIWGTKVRLDQTASPDSPLATPEGYMELGVWSDDDIVISGGTPGSTFTIAADAQSGTFTTYDNDLFINDGTADYGNSLNDVDQLGHASFFHGPADIPDQIYQAESGYLLRDPTDGSTIRVVEISFGSTNSTDKVYFSTAPLVAGRQYTLVDTRDGTPGDNNSNLNDSQEHSFSYPHLAPPDCFTAGTLIDTDTGPRAIETIATGDLVMTRDHGLQPVRWIGARRIDAELLAVGSHLRPVRIAAGALGPDRPAQDLVVSRQHRILIGSRIVQRMFGEDEILVPAKDLVDVVPGVTLEDTGKGVTYLHMMFDRHEIVSANGQPSETLLAAPQALKNLAPAALAELYDIFPELRARTPATHPARSLMRGARVRNCIRRHVQNRAVLSA